ncbi:MAG TPA: HAMP domain-containing sensor histidine kinase [Acidimicrobiales bacterium]|nr:HAMP domain-containing sensor histidine kinase [Acidimicrobiales bacterium]
MTRRLLLSYLGLALVVLAVLEIPLGVLALRHERSLSAQAAEREASGLAVFASEDLERHRAADLTALAARYHTSTGGEVSVIDTSGRVIAASDADADNDATTDDQALVQAALAGRPVNSFRSDEGHPWATAAAPLSDGGEPAGAVLLGIPSTATIDRVHDIWLALAAFGAGLLVFSGLVGLWLARSLTRPLKHLESTVAAFAGGDLAARARTGGPPEMRDLGARFNQMAARLQDLLHAQTRFVADASHQLRSPLTALRLRLENLEADAQGRDAQGIAAAGREVQRLTRIVDGLLTLGRAEGATPDRVPVDVDQTVTERCQSWSALADERGIRLVRPEPGRPPVLARLVPGDLDQMLDNLMANAIDALDAGGTIQVLAGTGGRGEVVVHVMDDGPGMTDEERERAFDRFWQGSTSSGGHSGLGLAIVAQLALRNDARVSLDRSEWGGVDASVVLPAAYAGTEGPDHGQRNIKSRQKLPS